jgi:hypothetical protein
MAIERDRDRRQPALAGDLDRSTEDRSVAEMHAVEEPDRDHGTLGGERQGSETAESFHHVEGNERAARPV